MLGAFVLALLLPVITTGTKASLRAFVLPTQRRLRAVVFLF
jgi:hypothetical protein